MAWWMSHLSFPWWIYAVVLMGLAAQIGAFVRALREWRARPWLSVPQTSSPMLWPIIALSTIGLGLPAAAALAFIEPGRKALVALGLGPPSNEMAFFHMEPYPWDRYGLLSHLPAWAALSAFLAALALTFALSARWKAFTARAVIDKAQPSGDRGPFVTPSTLEVGTVIFSFFTCAIFPFLIGIWTFNRRIQTSSELAANTPPGEHERIVLSGFPSASHALDVGALVGAIGILVAVAITVLFLGRWKKQGMAWSQHDRSMRRTSMGCALPLMLAGTLV